MGKWPMPLLPDRIDAGVVQLRRWHADLVDELLAAMLSSYPELHPWMDFAAEPPKRSDARIRSRALGRTWA
jgi:hypothetical protein